VGRGAAGLISDARVQHTEELDAANLSEDLLGENLVGGAHFDFAFRHVVRLVTDCEDSRRRGGD